MKGLRLLALACLLCSSVAAAQGTVPDDVRARAGQHFARGAELFQEEAYRAALVEFQRAYELAPDYRLLYNIAQAKLQLQDYLGAAQSYEGYLAEGGSAIAGERRTAVEGELAALRERIARVSVTVNRDGADIYLDDVKIGTSPLAGTFVTNVGRHRLSARAPDGATDARIVDVAGGDISEVALELAPPQQAKTIIIDSSERKQPWSTGKKIAVAGWSIGGALLIGGLITGLSTNGASDELDKQLKTADIAPSKVQSQRDTVSTLALTTDILIATGAVAAVAGTLFWLLDKPAEQKAEAETAKSKGLKLNAGLGSLSVSGAF
jgi:hypothetical protein